jgi:p-aminobenzoyl-glutamate transporter AbgT
MINFKIIFQYLKQKRIEEKLREKENRRIAKEQYDNLTLEEKARKEIDKCILLIVLILIILCIIPFYLFEYSI